MAAFPTNLETFSMYKIVVLTNRMSKFPKHSSAAIILGLVFNLRTFLQVNILLLYYVIAN